MLKPFYNTIIVVLLFCHETTAFLGGEQKSVKASRVVLPVLDELFHGTNHFSLLAMEELLNKHKAV